MGLYSWFLKRGSAGQTARVIARQYKVYVQQNPSATLQAFLHFVIATRNAVIPYKEPDLVLLKDVIKLLKHEKSTQDRLVFFTVRLILIEANIDWCWDPVDKRLERVVRDEIARAGI